MADDEQRLIEDARASREETQKVREESGLGREGEPAPPPDDDAALDGAEGEPWAKTSSGDADEITTDDD